MLPAYGLHGHIRNNNIKSVLLLAGFVVLMFAFWYALCLLWTGIFWRPRIHASVTIDEWAVMVAAHAGKSALAKWIVPVIAATAWLAVAYAFHASMIRAATGTKELTRRQHPRLYNMVERLAIESGLPMPRIEVMNTGALNAYAAGLTPETATIAVTRGLLQALTPDEVETVLAHEMAHIRNGDVRMMVVATVMTGGLTFVGEMAARMFQSRPNTGWSVGDISDIGFDLPDITNSEREGPVAAGAALVTLVSIVLAIALMASVHLFALLSKFAISRSREYLADAGAVELTKNPDALISALTKIGRNDVVPGVPGSLRAMMISNSLEGLFSTHPAISDRIAALQAMAGGRLPEPARRSRWGGALGSRAEGALDQPQGAAPATASAPMSPAVKPFLPSFGRRVRRRAA